MIINLNGKITDEKNAKISVASLAFVNGFAVYETLRTYHKKLWHTEAHFDRLYHSAEMMNLNPAWKQKAVFEELVKTMKKSPFRESRVRISLTEKDLIIYVEPLEEKPESFYKKGISLVSYAGKRNHERAKKTDSLCFLANRDAKERGAYDAILADDRGYAYETASANIFWVKSEKLLTTKDGILLGITREVVMELMTCNEKEIRLGDLLKADEVFITQTSSGILPVASIDGKKIGSGRPGPVTKKLMKAFFDRVWKKD